MAQLSLQVGPVTATETANDTKAQEILTLYCQYMGFEGTAQERADQVVISLARYMQDMAKIQNSNNKVAEAAEEAKEENEDLEWNPTTNPPPPLPPLEEFPDPIPPDQLAASYH